MGMTFTGKRCAMPPEDASLFQRIEVEFAAPIYASGPQMHALCLALDNIVKSPCNQFADGVHWVSGQGCKPIYSQADARFLGKAVDPSAPESGEPAFDDSVYFIETTAREFVSDDERKRVEKRRATIDPRPPRIEDAATLIGRLCASTATEETKRLALDWLKRHELFPSPLRSEQ